jgi:transcriptional regulator with XRE-family HTH domain
MSQPAVTPMAFKHRLKALRKEAGLTQMQLASAAGVTLSAVSQMEMGLIANPRLDTFKALAKALGCTLDVLGQDDDEPPGEIAVPPRSRKARK